MRKIVLLLTVVLALSGLVLVWFAPLNLDTALRKWFSLIHIWVGVFYLVIFTMYALDHIRANRRWLRIFALVTATGVTQTFSALLIMLTGIVLLLYGNAAGATLRGLHHWFSYALVGSIALHFLSRKN